MEWDSTAAELEVPNGHVLAAATKGEDGEIFYFTIEEGEPDNKRSTREAYLYKADYAGNTILKTQLDTKKETGINIYGMHSSCMLAYNNKLENPILSMHMARTMTAAYDGLNHQGGIFTKYHPQTLEIYHDDCWETASHSMGNTL